MKLKTTFREALCLAQLHAMERDASVLLYGLDVGDHKDTFGSTKGLKQKFGENRVIATPLSEDALCGMGIGAAIAGLRPVNIHIRTDFLLLCLNQLANIAGNVSYYSNGQLKVPLTIRAVIGRGWGQGAQHSKEVYQMFKYIPGVKVVIPSSVQDAYSLLYESIFDNNPVVFFEHRWLYDIEGQLDTEADHRFLANNAVSYFKKFPADANIPEYCGWEVIEAMKSKKDFWDTKGNSYQCLLPPVPTARHLEDEWYKMRYGKEDIETYEHRFRGPF
jgi:pyruvate/2-oxoglutarate/acetoin dehydrogenase E1 component